MESYKMCMCFTRKFKIDEVQAPSDIKEAFSRFTNGGTQMTAEQLLQFLIEFQGETSATISDAEQIINHVMRKGSDADAFTGHALGPEDFHRFLFNDDLNSPIKKQVHHDMTAPLSHYFIYTGHNSYLTGNQLSSESSDIPIIDALKRGVRVIELDIWPNKTGENVDVVHGRTLTSPVELIKCLRSIKEYAFHASSYPVVITLEDHLNADLQAKVAKMVTQTFGNMLFCNKSECFEEFPSPENLMRKIVLSTKPPKEYLEAEIVNRKVSSKEEAWGKELPSPIHEFFSSLSITDLVEGFRIGLEGDGENNQDDDDISGCGFDSSLSEVTEYKRLIAIHAKRKKGGLKEALKVEADSVKRLSLSEQKLLKAQRRYGTDLVRFTHRNLLRVYPRGMRLNSSNYNPLNGWMHGAQLVAFNMQGYGRSLWLMQGMFRSNGGCGYVKKPDILLQTNQVFDPRVRLPVKTMLKVRVYMGDGWVADFKRTHFDTYSPPDFYARVSSRGPCNCTMKLFHKSQIECVQVGIAGVPADAKMHKTSTVMNKWTPVWDKEFCFPLTVPELALLRVEVHEYDISGKDDFGGQTCLPVWELRPGIRAVPLFNRAGDKYPHVKLLMQFQFVLG